MSNLIFSLNATMPVFLMMVVGYILKRIGMLDDHSTGVINKLVFRVFLPALLFNDMAEQDFLSIWDGEFVLFCVLSTLISIVIAWLLSKFFCKETVRGEFVQASFRSGAATLGIAFMTGIYDNIAMVALMIIGCVPIYNVVSVAILSLTAPKRNESSANATVVSAKSYSVILVNTIKGIVTNPIIIGIALGTLWSLLSLPQPKILFTGIKYLANVASPLALIGLGASFEIQNLTSHLKPVLCATFNKLFLFVILFIPVCIKLGFRDEKIVAALIMVGTATTSSSFIMAKNMGHDGKLTSCVVMVTTLLSSFTLTLWLFILKTLGLI